MTYHPRQKEQSKETFRLVGGRHVRPGPEGRAGIRTTIERGDTLHLTQREADFFGDKFQLVLPETAHDVKLTMDEDAADEAAPEAEAATEEMEEEDEVDVRAVTGQAGLSRDDFSSQKAFERWANAGKPDMSGSQRSGHGGRTYSVTDVKKVAP